MKMKLDNDVLDVLKNCTVDGPIVRMPQLDRKLYVRVNKVLELLGGKWTRAKNGHEFKQDPGDVILNAVMAGEVTDLTKLYQFYETPSDLADELVQWAGLSGLETILEPSAGRGRLIDAIKRRYPNTAVSFFEIQKQNVIETIEMREAKGYKGVTLLGGDFIAESRPDFIGYFDHVIANPPFSGGQDMDHVKRMALYAKAGGVITTVMSPAFEFWQTKKAVAFREWLDNQDHDVRKVEAGAFKESGTMVNTRLVRIVVSHP
jgi:predicted RNA methylase